MINQTYKWNSESQRFVKKFLNIKHPWKNNIFFKNILNSNIYNKKIKNILDVGCGNGKFLDNICLKTSVKKMGVETSSTSINILKQKYKKINFTKAYCHELPFKDDSYDFVYAFMMLHCIDRNNYLQSLGELLRVTKKFLMIVDFDPSEPYFRKYKHKKKFYVYKDNYDLILSNSGFLKKINENRFYINEKNEICKTDKKISSSDLRNHHMRKLTIYEKTITLKKIK